jgi:hypothetical protein
MPLPEGDWRVAGIADETPPANQPGGYGVIDSAVLMHLNGSRVDAFILIHTNVVPVNHGWGVTETCTRATAPFTRIDNGDGQNAFCGFVRAVTIRHDPGAAGAWQSALTLAAARGWTVPEHWLMAGLRISDRHDVIDMRYHFDPDRFAPKPLPAEAGFAGFDPIALWRQLIGDGSDDPALRQLDTWTGSLRDSLERGFRGRLAGNPAPALPWTGAKAGDPAARQAGGLAEVRALHDAGLLTDAQYGAQVQTIAAPAGPSEAPPAGSTPIPASVLKMMSWKAIATTSGLTIKYLFLGNPMTVAGLQATQSLVSGALYVGYDLLWATLVPDGKNPVIDFQTATVSS